MAMRHDITARATTCSDVTTSHITIIIVLAMVMAHTVIPATTAGMVTVAQASDLVSDSSGIGARDWAWIILLGLAIHVKGFGSALCSMTKRLIAACKSTTDRKMPRFNRRFVSLAKTPSMATTTSAQLVDEAPVGGRFELFHPMRLQAVRAPDALDGTRATPATMHEGACLIVQEAV